MTNHIGRLMNVGIAKEASRGTAEAVDACDFWLPCKAFNHVGKVETAFDDSALGTISEVQGSEVVQEYAEGGFEALIGDKSFGLILLALLGAVSSAVNETTAYDHTYTLDETAQHDSLTLFLDSPNKDARWALSMINALTINYEKGKLLDFSCDMLSKKEDGTAVSSSYATENRFRPQDFGLKLATTVAGLGAAALVPVDSFSITFEKNLEMDQSLGDTEPNDILNKNFNITGEFTLIWDSKTYETYVLAGTNYAMRVDLTNSDVTIGAVSNPQLTFDLEPCALTEIAMETGLNDLVRQTITFRGQYNPSTSKIIDNFVLTNEQTAY